MKDEIPVIPCQMDICFTEYCNLDCAYCFIDKTSKEILDFPSIKKAVDLFLSLPGKSKTITFTTSEPFINFELYRQSIVYISQEIEKRQIDLNMITTTNGTLLKDEIVEFVTSYLSDKFILNLSLDGARESTDSFRKFKAASQQSVFESAWPHFKKFPSDRVRVIFTIAPEQVAHLTENVEFLIDNGFKHIDLFPQMFCLWGEGELDILKERLEGIVRRYNQLSGEGFSLRLLNRLWGSTHYEKILLGSDKKFYLFEFILSLAYENRTKYVIGDLEHGIDLARKKAIYQLLVDLFDKETGAQCQACDNKQLCAHPFAIYLWCKYQKKDFRSYYKNFCQIAEIMINAGRVLKIKTATDLEKWDNAGKKTELS